MLSLKYKLNKIAIGYSLVLLAVLGCLCLIMAVSAVPADKITLQPPEITKKLG
ncbi:hypothetical protein [Aeromonas jandaei]|uniref:hypothetical protein n=1 Tax=Aeromonas jandaei TaxID=650 RepID=UPI002B05AFA5|nr:hypothetical protein [Aeromonas jandaei]